MPDSQLVNPQGEIHDVAASGVENLLGLGWRHVLPEDINQQSNQAADASRYGGVGGGVKAGLAGLARGATLGLSDLLARPLEGDEGATSLLRLKEQNPGISAGSELTGALLGSVAGGPAGELAKDAGLLGRASHAVGGAVRDTLGPIGGVLPSGIVGRLGHAVTGSIIGEGSGLLARTAGTAIGAGVEGALYGAGDYVGQTALENKPLAAEAFLGSMGKGALWGASIGGALSLGSEALTRARSLFPRSEMTAAAGREASRGAQDALAASVRDGDSMLVAAKQRLQMAEAEHGAARSGENAARAMFGGAGDAAAVDQVASASEHQELSQAIDHYTTSRDALDQWIRTEADPELEKALLGVRSPDIQVGAPRLRSPEFGEVVPPQTFEPSSAEDFARPRGMDVGGVGSDQATGVGKLARGTPGPHEPPKVPATTELPPLPLPEAPPGMPEIPGASAGARGAPAATIPFDFEQSGLRFDPKTRTYHDVAKPPDMPGMPVPEPAFKAHEPLSDSEYDQYKKEYSQAATNDHFGAEMYYSKGGDELVNPQLRSGKPLTPKAAQLRDQLNDAFSLPESRIARPTTVYRGVSDDPVKGITGVRARFADAKPGDVLDDPAFLSTTYDAKSKSRNEHVVFTISAPAGQPALPIRGHYSSEKELLLPAHTKMRVDKIEILPVTERWSKLPHGSFEVMPDKSVHFTGGDGKSTVWPPIKDIHVTILDEHAPPKVTRSAANIDLNSPIEKLSERQLLKYKEALGKAFDDPTAVGARRTELYALDETATKRLRDFSDGKITPPAEEWAGESSAPAAPGAAVPGYTPIDETFKTTRNGDNLPMHMTSAERTRSDGRKVVEIRIEHSPGDGGGDIPVGIAEFVHQGESELYPLLVSVDDDFQRMGIGTRMYDAAEESTGRLIVNANDQSPEGAAFRMARAKRKAPADGDLTSLLQGTKSKLDAGDSLIGMGAPARAEYAAAKSTKTAEAAEHFRGKAHAAKIVAGFDITLRTEAGTVFDANPTIEHGVPSPGGVSRETYRKKAYVLRPSELVGKDLFGLESGDMLTDARTVKFRDAWKAGERVPPLEIDVDPRGRYFVADGNHRLIAAALDGDRQVVARFRPVEAEVGNMDRIGPILGDAIGSKAPRASLADRGSVGVNPTDPETDLERLLRGTNEGVGAGKSMRELREIAGTPTVNAGVEATAPIAATHAPAGHPPLPDPAARTPEEFKSTFGFDQDALPKEIQDLFGIESGSRVSDLTSVEPGMRGAMDRVRDDDAIEKALRKHVGKGVDLNADLTKAARVIGDHEAASAKLVDLLGPEAPIGAQQSAAAYHAATAAQSDAAASAAAKSAGDAVAAGPPTGQATAVDSDITRALRAHDSASMGASDRAIASMNRQASKEAAKATAAPRKGGALKLAADVGTALEVLHAMGVNTPDLSAIPVIGPVLSLFLKARAVLGILGRKGGSVGSTAETVIAGKAAALRDRVNAAAHAVLDASSKALRRAAPIAGPAGALAHRLFPGDGDTTSKDPQTLYKARLDELARAQTPGAIDAAIRDRVRTSDPNLQDAITAQAQRATAFLASKAPQQGMFRTPLPGDGEWHASKAALDEFAKYAAAVHDPAGVLEDLANGHVTIEGAETLRVVYPQLYATAQRILIERAPQMTKTMPYARRVALSIMFQIPVDGTMSAQHMQYLSTPAPGAARPSPQSGGGGGTTGPLQIGQQTMTSLERRAGA